MTVVGEAFVRLRPDSSGFGPEAESGIGGALGNVAKKIGLIIGGAFAAREVIHGIGDLLEAGTNLNRQLSLTNAAVKSTGGIAHVSGEQIQAFAEKQALLTGIAATTVIGQERVLLAFTSVRNEVGKGNDIYNQAVKAADNLSVALGKGLQGATVLVGRALQDPIKGLTGLGRAGVQFTTQQKDLIKSLVETGHTLDAQKLILAAVEQRFGGAAEAGATAGAKIKAAFESAKEQVGLSLVPIANAVTNAFIPIVPKITSVITSATKLIGPKLTPIVALLPRLFTTAFGVLTKIVTSIVLPVFKVLRQVFVDLEPTLRKLRDTVVDTGKSFSGSFGGLGDLFRTLLSAFEPLLVAVLRFALTDVIVGIRLFGDAVRVVSDVVTPLLPALTQLAQFVSGVLGLAFVVATLAVEGIGNAISGFVAPIESAASKIGQTLGPILGAAVDIGREALRNFVLHGIRFVTSESDKVAPALTKLHTFFKDNAAVISAAAVALTTFVTAITAINQIENAVATAQTAFNLLGPAVSSAIAPLLATGPIGIAIAIVLAIGAAFVFAYVKIKPFHDAVNATAIFLRDVGVKAFESARDAVLGIAPVFAAAGSAIAGAARTVASVVSGLASSIVTALTPLGRFINDNLISTLGSAVDFFSALFVKIGQVLRPIVTEITALLRLFAGVIRDELVAAFKILEPIVLGALRAIGDGISTFAHVAVPLFLTAFDAVAAVVRFTFDTVKAIIVAALSVIRGFFTLGAGLIRGDFGKIWQGLELIVEAPFKLIQSIVQSGFSNVLRFLGTLPGRFATIGAALFRGLLLQVSNVGRTLTGVAQGAVSGLIDTFTHLPGQLAKFLGSGGTALSQGVVALVSGLPTAIGNAITTVLPVIGGFLLRLPLQLLTFVVGADVWFAQTGIDVLRGLLTGLVAGVQLIVPFARSLPGRILGLVGDVSTVLLTKGVQLVVGLLSGLVSALPSIATFFINLPGKAIAAVGNVLLTLEHKGEDLISGILTGLVIGFVKVEQFFTGVPSKIITALGDVASSIAGIGSAIIEGIVSGISDAWHKVTDKLHGLMSHLPGFMKGILGISSPAKATLPVGAGIALGVLAGLEQTFPAVNAAIGSFASGLNDQFAAALSISVDTSSIGNALGSQLSTSMAAGIRSNSSAIAAATSGLVVHPALDVSGLTFSGIGDAVVQSATTLSDRITTGLKTSGIGEDVGALFAQGIGRGLERNTDAIRKVLEGFGGSGAGGLQIPIEKLRDLLGGGGVLNSPIEKLRELLGHGGVLDTPIDELRNLLGRIGRDRPPPPPIIPQLTAGAGLRIQGEALSQRPLAVDQQAAIQLKVEQNFTEKIDPEHVVSDLAWKLRGIVSQQHLGVPH